MGLAILAGLVGLVGLLDLTTLLDLTGLVGLRCQIWLFLGIFWIFNLKNLNLKVIQMKVCTSMIQRNSMIPKSLMIQREFQLEV